MTGAPHSASHRRSPSPPAARRNTSATPARGRQSSCDRAQPLAPVHRRNRKRPPLPLPPKTPSAARSPTPASLAVRDPQIPIGALAKRSPYLPRGFLLGRLSSAGPGVDVHCRGDEPGCGGGRRRRVVFRRLWPRRGRGDGIPSGGERVGMVLTNAETRPRPRPVSAITPDTPLHEVAINTWMCVERMVTPRQRRWRIGRAFCPRASPRRLA